MSTRSQRWGGIARHLPPVEEQQFKCHGCQWRFKYRELLEAHLLNCDAVKAKALPKDDDAEGWRALAERMKQAALLAQAKGRTDEYAANLRRSDECMAKANAAKAARIGG